MESESIRTDKEDRTSNISIRSYLNTGSDKYEELKRGEVFVDKSMLLAYTNSVAETPQKYICFSRPRRFGKTADANMICAYYDRTAEGKRVFDGLKISQTASYPDRMGKYDVIFLNIQDFLSEVSDVQELNKKICDGIIGDIAKVYSDKDITEEDSLIIRMQNVYAKHRSKFVIVIDEWDCIFREWKNKADEQREYLDFLRWLLKDKSYIALVYMTGILPIKKYGSHSALNMFDEFSMENPGRLAEFVGFTEREVKEACDKRGITFTECKRWYDGYSFKNCNSVYNPRSVIKLLQTGEFDDYWNQTESYEALREYINLNYDGVRDTILALMANDRREIDTGSFTNDMTTFANADDVLTLLIHLGYLGYDREKKQVFIPNKEIMQEFVTTTKATKWNEVIRSINRSKELLSATLNGDEDTVAKYIEEAHFETSHIQYNDENALSYTISLAYYAARDDYEILREMPGGKGFADLVFLPRERSEKRQAMIVELKWDRSADTAIQQIKEKRYTDPVAKIGGEVLLVGISYDKKTKMHECQIEKFMV